ncbi:MAG: hypothetical protein V1905_03485 [bacterium]
MTKVEVKREFTWSIEDRGRRAANVFDPHIAHMEIDQLRGLLSSVDGNTASAEMIIRKSSLLDEFRRHYAQGGEKPPMYRNNDIIEWVHNILKDNNHRLYGLIANAINQKIELLRAKIAEYNALPLKERGEIENQFPCYIVVEAEGIMDELIQRPKEAEGKLGGVGGKIIELWSHNRIPPERIRVIQVPESKIPEVKEWLKEANITGVRVVPFEYFEMKEVLEKVDKKN